MAIEWGSDDCTTFMFGERGPEIPWLLATEEESWRFIHRLTPEGRKQHFLMLVDYFGLTEVPYPEPGVLAVGEFYLVPENIPLLSPWFAKCGEDLLFRTRTRHGTRVVGFDTPLQMFKAA